MGSAGTTRHRFSKALIMGAFSFHRYEPCKLKHHSHPSLGLFPHCQCLISFSWHRLYLYYNTSKLMRYSSKLSYSPGKLSSGIATRCRCCGAGTIPRAESAPLNGALIVHRIAQPRRPTAAETRSYKTMHFDSESKKKQYISPTVTRLSPEQAKQFLSCRDNSSEQEATDFLASLRREQQQDEK